MTELDLDDSPLDSSVFERFPTRVLLKWPSGTTRSPTPGKSSTERNWSIVPCVKYAAAVQEGESETIICSKRARYSLRCHFRRPLSVSTQTEYVCFTSGSQSRGGFASGGDLPYPSATWHPVMNEAPTPTDSRLEAACSAHNRKGIPGSGRSARCGEERV